MERINDDIVWTRIFRRHLREDEETEPPRLLGALNEVLVLEGDDCRVWAPSKERVFTLSSFFSALSRTPTTNSHYDFLWKSKVPLRVLAFAWLVL